MSKVGWWERKFSPSSILHKIGLLYPWKKRKIEVYTMEWTNVASKSIKELHRKGTMNQFTLKNEVARLYPTLALHYPLTPHIFCPKFERKPIIRCWNASNSFCTVPILPPPETCLIQIRKPITLVSKWIMAKSSHHHLINVARQHFIAF